MKFFNLINLLASGIVVIASPASLATNPDTAYVLDTTGLRHDLRDSGAGNIRTIADKVNGEYVHPKTFHIALSHACRFYSESTRGIGYFIGEYTGPSSGEFGNHWAAFYECWNTFTGEHVATSVNAREETLPSSGISFDDQFCGHVETFAPPNGDHPSYEERIVLTEGIKPVYFESYTERSSPSLFWIDAPCTCVFWTVPRSRGWSQLIKTVVGPANGDMDGKPAAMYTCKRNK